MSAYIYNHLSRCAALQVYSFSHPFLNSTLLMLHTRRMSGIAYLDNVAPYDKEKFCLMYLMLQQLHQFAAKQCLYVDVWWTGIMKLYSNIMSEVLKPQEIFNCSSGVQDLFNSKLPELQFYWEVLDVYSGALPPCSMLNIAAIGRECAMRYVFVIPMPASGLHILLGCEHESPSTHPHTRQSTAR